MKATALALIALAALAVAGGLAAWAADSAGGSLVSGADVLVLRFQTADGKLARTLRVQPTGEISWKEELKGVKPVAVGVWLERGGVAAPYSVGQPAGGQVDPSEFVIGPGDVLDVNVWKKPELSRQVPVRPDGRVTLPLVGDVAAAGRTTNQLKDELDAAFTRFVGSPEVTVIVSQIHSYQVFVQGQVARPGAYPMSGRTTVVQAIGLAGGFTQFAATGGIVILRQGAAGSQRLEISYARIPHFEV
jgi:polysaccharide export outer membrane protein